MSVQHPFHVIAVHFVFGALDIVKGHPVPGPGVLRRFAKH